jgi:DNA-binding PadR family transcriptional regulator
MDYRQTLDSIKSELRRGTQMVAVLSLLDRNQYGYSLLQDLIDKGVAIEAGTLYPLLRRLESQGILESRWDTSESRPRKYYTLSFDGKRLYDDLKQEWNDLVKDMDALMKGERK